MPAQRSSALDYQRLFEATSAPFLILTPAFCIVAVNQAYLDATRTRRELLLGRSIFDAFPDNPGDPAADGVTNLRRSLETVLATGRTDVMALQRYDIPVAGDPSHFEERHWSPVNAPVLDADGSITHIIHRVEDVTEFVRIGSSGREQQVRMEAELFTRARELQDANRQLRDLNDELARTGQALRDQQQAKDRFIATLSHELRNPLGAARAAVDVLQLEQPDGHPALAVLDRQLGTLVRMTDDLLDVSRALSGQATLLRQRLDLREVLDVAVQDFRSRPAGSSEGFAQVPADPATGCPALRGSFEPGGYPVDGDRIRLAQALGNLLSNARKYSGASGTVTVTLGREDAHAVLSVADDGIGFDPADAEGLFEVFARAVPAGGAGPGGLGLGLAIVRTVVELHGGTVSAHSAGPGTGARFTLRLPLSRSAAPAGQAAAPAQGPVRPLAILVVDDNADLAATFQTLLEDRRHAVTVVHTGRAALAALAAGRFDVVLCDLGLPDLDGLEVARRIRATPATRHLRLVAVSGFSQRSDHERTRRAGFDAHLAKPMDVDELEVLLADWTYG